MPISLMFAYYRRRLSDGSSVQTTLELLCRVFDVLGFLKTFSKGRRIIRERRIGVQDARAGTIRLKAARDSREQHKVF